MGLSMDTWTHSRGAASDAGAKAIFLPPEAPTTMAKQPLRGFQRKQDSQTAAFSPVALRSAFIFTGTAALTIAGCYEMYGVVQVGGVTTLEWMVLFLFVFLFAWIAFSFMSALAGFAVLLFSAQDPVAHV